ncbi:YncE family protein [Aliiglaciecola litoralis]|uniref:YNCE-like beta-propeller domain-containing protein n=1 Tax=Aliiglaciecola litoralis TaxID=582857 RepID=A0ABN1LNI1_9ALTE
MTLTFKSIRIVVLVSLLFTAFISVADEHYVGTVLVVNKGADTVSFIDLSSREIVKTLPTGKGPHELAITQDGKWAVTTDYVGGNSLTVIDVENAKVVRTISLANYPRPHGILFLDAQTHVAVSSEGSDSAVIVNIHTGNILTGIDTTQQGSHMVALSKTADVIYTTNMGSNSVSVLDAQTATLSHIIPMPETPEAITVNDAGTRLWVGSNKDGLVSVFDLDSDKMISQFDGYTFPYRILLNQNQQYAVVPDYRQNTLDIFDAETLKRLKRIELANNAGPKGVSFHPDGKTLFLSLYQQNNVIAVDIPSGKVLFTLPTGDGPDGIGYSPFILKRD